jgi:hypothetical protein
MEQNWWEARLRPEGPNYAEWAAILEEQADNIPLISPLPMKATLGEDLVEIYLIDWNNLEGGPADNLTKIVMKQLHLTEVQAMQYLEIRGSFPIRVVDVDVSSKIQSWV